MSFLVTESSQKEVRLLGDLGTGPPSSPSANDHVPNSLGQVDGASEEQKSYGMTFSLVSKGHLLRSIKRPVAHPKDTKTGDVVWGQKATSTRCLMEGNMGLEEVVSLSF